MVLLSYRSAVGSSCVSSLVFIMPTHLLSRGDSYLGAITEKTVINRNRVPKTSLLVVLLF